jgi:hypothetical protein
MVTTPALNCFWTWNDDLVGHQRRYSRKSLTESARQAGLVTLDCRYFMFFLSPLLLASRWLSGRRLTALSEAEKRELLERMHRVPAWPINLALQAICAAETPLGHWIRLPWGTSALAIFQKPA